MATDPTRWLCQVVVVMVMCVGWSVGTFNLTILHTNDIHARYDQTDSRSGHCSDSDAQEGKCYGGFPRLQTKVKEARTNYSNVVLVDAGDQFQGTIWFSTFGPNITSHFMNALNYSVMALGNHEFDLGPPGVEKLVSRVTFPVLSSNIDASPYPVIHSRVQKRAILETGGERIGFVGYTTVDTVTISQPKKVTFADEVQSVREQVKNLTMQGVNKIVCVGHAGFTKDLKIAREVVGVDVVVGGHTNTFLYTGTPPSREDPVGLYPEVVTRADGSRALVVQDYAFGKYLGFLQVQFDDRGEVTSWSGNPILLDNSVPRDPDLLAEVNKWAKDVETLRNQTVGRTAVLLEGEREVCRQKECNFGNVIADAMVTQNLRYSDAMEWNHVAIALVNSGGIRASVPKGPITVADVLTVQPFRGTIDIIEITGSTLRAIMEHSASEWDPAELHGGFLQHSGLRVVYKMSNPVGSRVLSIKVKCTRCPVPQFVDVDDRAVYKVIVPSFLAEGGDGYKVITSNTLHRHLNGVLDSDVLTEHFKQFSPITQGLEGRITFGDPCSTSGADVISLATSLGLLTLMGVIGTGLAVLP